MSGRSRLDPVARRHRRWEALLGYEPDEAPDATIARLQADAASVGDGAMAELAAAAPGRTPEAPRVADLRTLAASVGVQTSPSMGVLLRDASSLLRSGDVPAWVRGTVAARALRAQEHLGLEPLRDGQLADMVAIDGQVLEAPGGGAFSFELHDNAAGRVVLRSTPWKENRRFELARLLGDRLGNSAGDRLLPATKALTYRQKWQRAFAAELLCPFDGLEATLDGDLSDDAIDSAAARFGVSGLAARMVLVNHGLLERGDGAAAASAA